MTKATIMTNYNSNRTFFFVLFFEDRQLIYLNDRDEKYCEMRFGLTPLTELFELNYILISWNYVHNWWCKYYKLMYDCDLNCVSQYLQNLNFFTFVSRKLFGKNIDQSRNMHQRTLHLGNLEEEEFRQKCLRWW